MKEERDLSKGQRGEKPGVLGVAYISNGWGAGAGRVRVNASKRKGWK